MRRTFLTLLGSSALTALAATALSAQTVTVRSGDTLSLIAEAEFGDAARWRELCEINRAVVGANCNTIAPGMVLQLSSAAPAADVEAEAPAVEETASVDAVEEAAETAMEATEDMMDAEADTEVAALPARPDISPAGVEGGEVVFNFAADSRMPFVAPDGYAVVRPEDANFVRLSGFSADASSGGRTGGIYVSLGNTFEAAATGRRVQIDALVRLQTPGEIQMAYSTSAIGNSGWRTLAVDEAFGTVSFTYEIPAGANGNGEYLGILPDPDNAGQVLDISFLAVTVVE